MINPLLSKPKSKFKWIHSKFEKQIKNSRIWNYKFSFMSWSIIQVQIGSPCSNFINFWKFKLRSIKFYRITNPRASLIFLFKFYPEFWKVSLRKVLPYLIPHKSLFYLEFFEQRKVNFEPWQILITLKILKKISQIH